MNGAFVLDLVREGAFLHPIDFGRQYYSHYPALSLPYHPPLFPLEESLLFAVLGVSYAAARIAISFSVGLSVLLFYRLILATGGSRALAAASILTFFSLNVSVLLSTDIMLEFPALVFTLAALLFLRDMDDGFSIRSGLLFGLFAGAAVWTKQLAVFLVLTPFLFILVSRKWRLLKQPAIWLASFVFACLTGGLAAVSIFSGVVGRNTGWPKTGILGTVSHNLGFYVDALRSVFGLVPTIFLGVVIALFLFLPSFRRHQGKIRLMLAWAFSGFLFLLLLPPFAERYLFLAYPPLIVIGYAGLFQISQYSFTPKFKWILPAVCCLLAVFAGLSVRTQYLSGPLKAARFVSTAGPVRVIYCGVDNGAFIFAMRSIDPGLHNIVIRGDKLPASTFKSRVFEEFAHRYGIDYILLEEDPTSAPWDCLRSAPASSMRLQRAIHVSSSYPDRDGSILIYRFLNPSSHPRNTLRVPSTFTGRELNLRF